MKHFARRSSYPWSRLGFAAGILTVIHLPATGADAQDDPGAGTVSGPIEMKLGPFDFQPRASSTVTFDDNINFSPQNTVSDFFWDLDPGIQAVAGDKLTMLAYRDQGADPLLISPDSLVAQSPDEWPGKLLILDDSPQFEWYTENPKDNYIGDLGTINAVLPATKFILGARANYTDQPITVVEASERAGERIIEGDISGAYFISDKTSVDTALTYYKLDYMQQAGLTGYAEGRDVTWVNYQLTGLLNVSAGLTAAMDDVAGGYGQEYGQLLVRARYQFAEKLAFDASAGGELRHYDNGVPDTLIPVFDLGATYNLTPRTVLNLSGSRSINASVIGGRIYTVTGMTMAAKQGITDRLDVRLQVDYSYYEPVASLNASPISASDYFSAQLTFGFKITRQWEAALSYTYRTYIAQSSPDVVDDRAALQLTWKY